MKKCYSDDLYRYYGDKGETWKQRLNRSQEIKFIVCFRKVQEAQNPILRVWRRIRLKRISEKSKIQIPWTTKIGRGFYIGHTGTVIVNPNAVIGNNVNIAVGVTIGQENRGKRAGAPHIGNSVWIGTNAVVVGKIEIGNDVLIAPNAYVNMDVPDHSIVVGNPATIIHSEHATEGYINRVVES